MNLDRYDDRVIVQTNLIESYEMLMQFAEKHLWDKFYIEDGARVSLRSVITHEMLVNTLIHREFLSPYYAKFIIQKDKMYTENANRATVGGNLTPDNFEPNPKNPIIAAFFRNIWLAEELGSGVRNLFRYVRRYSGKDPEMIDGDIFRTIVPLDDNYSFDAAVKNIKNMWNNVGTTNGTINGTINGTFMSNDILSFLIKNPTATQAKISESVGKSLRAVKRDMAVLQDKGLLRREGSKKRGTWVVNIND